MSTALAGLRVLEVGFGTAGAMAGMVLAENGAEVVKVEPPSGDPGRADNGWPVWNRGKHSVVIDLAALSGREQLASLAAQSDGVICTLAPGTAQRLGADWPTLCSINPGLVMVDITGFGERGPLADMPGYEYVVAARTGRMNEYQGVRPGPIHTPVPVACFGAAMLATQGLLAGLWARRTTGRGQRVHTSLLHGLSVYDMTSGHGNRTHRAQASGMVFGVMRVPFMTAPTADGRFIQMCSRQPHHYRRWLTELGLETWFDDPDLAHMPDLFPSEERITQCINAITDAMQQRPAQQWMEVFAAKDIGGDPFLTPSEFLAHPQAKKNDRVQSVGETVQIGPLGFYSETPSEIGRPAPLLGSFKAPTSTDPPHPSGSPPNNPDREAQLPLAGVTVVECGYFYATPFAATLLAEMGARIIKVEPPGGDPGRRNWTGQYVKAMVGKESVVLDLKTPDGLALMYRLVDQADVFIHNFRPGTPERLGIDYDTLIARNPQLLYVYGSCFGSQGPWSHKAGFHSSPNAIAGAGVVESGDTNPPRNRTYADPASALATAAAILVGLHGCAATGRGQYLETIMCASMAYAVSEWGTTVPGKVDRTVDQQQRGFDQWQKLYETADGWIYVDCHTAAHRQALLEKVGTEMDFSSQDADEWARELAASGVPAARADNQRFGDFMLNSEHARACGVSVLATQQDGSQYWRAGPTLQFSEATTPLAPSASLGSSTEKVLIELGLSPAEISELAQAGVTTPVGHDLPD